MIEVKTFHDLIQLADEIDLPEDAAERMVDKVLELAEDTAWTIEVLKDLGTMPDTAYKTLRGFILDLLDVMLKEIGIDASEYLDTIDDSQPIAVVEFLFGEESE